MKYLEIKDNRGYFLRIGEAQESEMIEIDRITKEDLMSLLNVAIKEDFEMDEFETDKLGHKAHQIIYKNIHEKFTLLLESKDKFKDESETLYKGAFEKYSQPAEDGENLI